MIIRSGDQYSMVASVGSVASRGLRDYLEERSEEFGRRIRGTAAERYHNDRSFSRRLINIDEVSRRMRAVTRRIGHMWQQDIIRDLNDIGDFQNAPSSMLRWLAADPEIKRDINLGRLAAWEDRYENESDKEVGENHRDYRILMDGVYRHEEGEFVSVEYHEPLFEGEEELSITEVGIILSAQERLKRYMSESQEDPTSRYNLYR